jgi:hypothetical protein
MEYCRKAGFSAWIFYDRRKWYGNQLKRSGFAVNAELITLEDTIIEAATKHNKFLEDPGLCLFCAYCCSEE